MSLQVGAPATPALSYSDDERPKRLDPQDDPVFAWGVARSEQMRRERAERERDALLDAAARVMENMPGGAAAQRGGTGPIARLADIVWHLNARLPLPAEASR